MLLIGASGYSGLYHRTEEVRNRSPPVAKKLLYLIFWQKRACLCSVPSNRNTAKKQWGGIWNSCNVFHLLILYRESTDFLCGSDPPIACGGILSGDIGGWVHVAGIERIPEKSRFMWICDANFLLFAKMSSKMEAAPRYALLASRGCHAYMGKIQWNSMGGLSNPISFAIRISKQFLFSF